MLFPMAIDAFAPCVRVGVALASLIAQVPAPMKVTIDQLVILA